MLAEQRAHLGGAAQVGGDAGRRVPQHRGVPGRPVPGRLGRVARPRADERGQQPLGGGPVHRQALRRQFRAQQFGRGFRSGRGQRRRAQPGQRRLLEARGRDRQLRPPGKPAGAGRPAAVRPFGLQVPAGPDRVGGVTGFALLEQVGLACGRDRRGRQVAQVRPRPARVGAPPAEQQPVDRADVPAGRQAHALGPARPHHPPGPQAGVDEPDGGLAAGRRDRPGAPGGRKPEAHARAGGQPDQIPAGHTSPVQLRQHVHAVHPATPP